MFLLDLVEKMAAVKRVPLLTVDIDQIILALTLELIIEVGHTIDNHRGRTEQSVEANLETAANTKHTNQRILVTRKPTVRIAKKLKNAVNLCIYFK